jgi:hypothetical protein
MRNPLLIVWLCESAPRPPVTPCCLHQSVSSLLLTPYRSTTVWSPPETKTLSSSDISVSFTIAATVRVIGSLVETPDRSLYRLLSFRYLQRRDDTGRVSFPPHLRKMSALFSVQNARYMENKHLHFINPAFCTDWPNIDVEPLAGLKDHYLNFTYLKIPYIDFNFW